MSTTSEVLSCISEIDEFKGSWRTLKNLAPERLQSLKATIESVGSSTRIEGSKLSDKDVALLLGKIGKHPFKNRDEEEVAGYAECMTVIFENHAEIVLSENYIKQLHQILLQYAHKDTRHRGQYKKYSNQVGAFDQNKKSLGVIFKTATPFATPLLMEKLIAWTNETLKHSKCRVVCRSVKSTPSRTSIAIP